MSFRFTPSPWLQPLRRLPYLKQERGISLLAVVPLIEPNVLFRHCRYKKILCAVKDICSKMDNKCPFPNSLLFSANHWMAVCHFVSHFANSADNGSYLWPEKLFSINYCISHKASPLLSLIPSPYQTTTVKYCKWSCLIFTYPPPTLHHFIITVLGILSYRVQQR